MGLYSGEKMFSLPGGTSSGCNGIDTSATLYPCGKRRSNDVEGNEACSRVAAGCASSCSAIRSGGVLSSRIAGG